MNWQDTLGARTVDGDGDFVAPAPVFLSGLVDLTPSEVRVAAPLTKLVRR